MQVSLHNKKCTQEQFGADIEKSMMGKRYLLCIIHMLSQVQSYIRVFHAVNSPHGIYPPPKYNNTETEENRKRNLGSIPIRESIHPSKQVFHPNANMVLYLPSLIYRALQNSFHDG